MTLVVILVEMGRVWKCSITMQEGADYDAGGLATRLQSKWYVSCRCTTRRGGEVV